MSAALPEIVDPWRMAQARRSFAGHFPLARMPRLASALAETRGDVEYELDFGKDELGISGVHVKARAALPLTCQRSLEIFELPVAIDVKLGFIRSEDEEAGLSSDYEPLMLDAQGLRMADVIEDELILALPVIALKPGTQQVDREWKDEAQEKAAVKPNPFAVLKNVKL